MILYKAEKNLVGTSTDKCTHPESECSCPCLAVFTQCHLTQKGFVVSFTGKQWRTWSTVKGTRHHIVKLNLEYTVTSASTKHPITYSYNFSSGKSKTMKMVLLMPHLTMPRFFSNSFRRSSFALVRKKINILHFLKAGNPSMGSTLRSYLSLKSHCGTPHTGRSTSRYYIMN